jgi:uncharacterized membrane protein
MMSMRTLVILLGVSVALNLFFGGVLVARAWQRAEWRSERMAKGSVEAGPRRRPSAQPLRWLTEAERAELRPRRKALRGLRREAEELLRAESFDAVKLRASLGALRRETDAIQASVHESLIRQADGKSAGERRRLADANWGNDAGRGAKERGDRPRDGVDRHGKARGNEK